MFHFASENKGKLMYTRANVKGDTIYSARDAVKGEMRIVKGKLRKGREVIHVFEVSGKKRR